MRVVWQRCLFYVEQKIESVAVQIQKLHNDHAEMQAKCRHHVKECDDLKIHLAEAQEKLKTQEEINAKMTLELHYLRSNLAVLTNFPVFAPLPLTVPRAFGL